MIIKGSSRGQTPADVAQLARHLLAAENEAVEVLDFQGLTSTELAPALEEMRILAFGTRARRSLYHASINVARNETSKMTIARWMEAVRELEQHLHLAGHQRTVIRHVKLGREHIHIVWCRAHPHTLKVARDSHNYQAHEECARRIESRWGFTITPGAHNRPSGVRRPVAVATHDDWQIGERTGIRALDAAAFLQRAWSESSTGRDFASSIAPHGFQLARGRRGIIVVDRAGTPHALSRRLKVRVAEVQRRLADIDASKLPILESVQAAIKETNSSGRMNMKRHTSRYHSHSRAYERRSTKRRSLQLDTNYWIQFGWPTEQDVNGFLVVNLPDGTLIHDFGDELSLIREGEPTDEEIRILVAAGRSRGWEGIHFSGSEKFQRRAKVEALRQGFPPNRISLECEKLRPGLQSVASPKEESLPEHIRRRLFPAAESPPQSTVADTASDAAPEMQP